MQTRRRRSPSAKQRIATIPRRPSRHRRTKRPRGPSYKGLTWESLGSCQSWMAKRLPYDECSYFRDFPRYFLGFSTVFRGSQNPLIVAGDARLKVLGATLAVLFSATAVSAVQFDYLDPGFTQQIVIGPLTGGGGITWTAGGNMLVKDGANILEYGPTTNVYNGTNVHQLAVTHAIPGLLSGFGSGAAMATGLDGFIYVPTNIGLQRFSASLTGSAATLPGTVPGAGYGVTALSDGRQPVQQLRFIRLHARNRHALGQRLHDQRSEYRPNRCF
jgi:hypothetical protein